MLKHSNGKAKHVDKPFEKNNRQKEEEARASAERLLTPVESEQNKGATPPQAEEPSLEQRLADIDRRGRQRVDDEKRQLAADYLSQAQRRFKRAISNTTDEEVKKAYEEVQRLDSLAGGGGGSGGGGYPSSSASSESKSPTGRIRRSAETLQGEAHKILTFLKAHPRSKAGEIARGTDVDFGQSLSAFMSKYATGTKLKSEGSKSTTVYSIA